jgi:hypothetical protein
MFAIRSIMSSRGILCPPSIATTLVLPTPAASESAEPLSLAALRALRSRAGSFM